MVAIGKRSRIGVCNICGVRGPLTEDHVPPKGSVTITQMEMFNICDAMFAHRPEKKGKLFQSGIKFKSLCSKCNNDYLGARYDPSINQLSKDLADIVKTPIAVPPVASISVQINRVCRAVLGHLMAVGLDKYNDGEMANSCREYFLNSEIKEPQKCKNLLLGIPI